MFRMEKKVTRGMVLEEGAGFLGPPAHLLFLFRLIAEARLQGQ